MARALVRTGCPAEGTAAAGRQDTATRRSPRRLGLFAARHNASMTNQIRMVAFDGDDTLWRSQDFFDAAPVEFQRLVGGYVDLAYARVSERLYEFAKANMAGFAYGGKGLGRSR